MGRDGRGQSKQASPSNTAGNIIFLLHIPLGCGKSGRSMEEQSCSNANMNNVAHVLMVG